MTEMYLRPDGRVECLYSDDVQEMGIGVLSVRRASNVEFNDTLQVWEVRVKGVVKIRTRSRACALREEAKMMNMLLEDVKPTMTVPRP